MRKLIIMLAATLLASTIAISVMAETHTFAGGVRLIEITGKVRDNHGHPVAALKISLRNWFGADLASAVTDVNGVFDLRNVIPGRYYFNFRPLAEDSRGETVIIDVPAHLVHMNMTVNRNPPALARAHQVSAAIA